ncbi:NUDIX hydrolase [Actinoplanes sp. NPDC051470]|uniref:NUDIX hydrolase n=1 Tax=unclassified Actinoplanes TaxID=2626549 RepID=UPI0034362285
MTDVVRAAGAVLWRGPQVCVVHRPQYDDWSLPKGKLEADELSLTAAVREVAEETGVRGEPLLRLPDVTYALPDGRRKQVEFWLMRATDDPVLPVADPDEVDEIAWLSPAEAAERLSYPADRDLLGPAAIAGQLTGVTLLVRHAHAGERKKWQGNDALRPIDEQGQGEAARIAEVLGHFGPRRLVAATPLRCKQTLEPLAGKLGLPIVTDPAFAEPAEKSEIPARVKQSLTRLAELRSGPTTAICSQGKVMPHVLAALAGADDPDQYRTRKGGGWAIAWAGDRVAAISPML